MEFLLIGAVISALSEEALATIVIATITAVGGIVVAFIQSLRKDNKNDHLSNQAILLRMDDKQDAMHVELTKRMDRIEQKVDDHISHHAHKEGQGRARKR